jgi:NAD(P)-dependent dehydrogenase (short-subunit alcohol dehydrogenase family)
MKRFGEAFELIGCVNWLIDDETAGFVTGITVPVDGGFLADSGI